MTHTPYTPGTLVLVPPCHIHDGGVGKVKRAYLIKSEADRWSEALQIYDVEVAGDVLWYAESEVEEV